LAAVTQMLWLTYAAITNETAKRYGVSVGAVGWLSEIFPLLYVVLAIPAGALLDRWFRPVLAVGAVLVATGGVVRLGGETFAWALLGQVLVAVAQPVVMSAIGKLAGEYLPVDERAMGISVASAGGFVGMLLALLLGPTVGGGGRLGLLLALEAGAGVAGAVALLVALRRPGSGSGESAAIERGVARSLWAQPAVRTLSGLAFLGFGVFVALSTWLEALIHPDGVSETAAGILLVGMIVAGVVGCAVLPAMIARDGLERRFMGVVVAVGGTGCAALGALPWIGVRAAVLVVMGLVLLPALPVILTMAEQLAGRAAGTAGAIVWLAGNLGGLVIALLVQALIHHPLAAFLAMAAAFLLATPLVGQVRAESKLGTSGAFPSGGNTK
jgi:predicted MFS family arabinose efflux permease